MIELNITSNIIQVLNFIEGKKKDTQIQVKNGMLKVGLLAQKESILNAPRKKGYLERSINMKSGDDYAMIFVASNSPAGAYAEIRHDDNYIYGQGTVAKGPRAGREYIQRAINDNINNFKLLLGASIKW